MNPQDLLIVSTNLSSFEGPSCLEKVKKGDTEFLNVLREKDTGSLKDTGIKMNVDGYRALELGLNVIEGFENFHFLGHSVSYNDQTLKESATGFGSFCFT